MILVLSVAVAGPTHAGELDELMKAVKTPNRQTAADRAMLKSYREITREEN